jgi:hypothetical protein
MGVITLIFSFHKLSGLALRPMSALSDGDTRCSPLERPRAGQNVRPYQKKLFALLGDGCRGRLLVT